MSFFEDTLEKLKKSNINELVELANDLTEIVELNLNYENLKINSIETGENLQADNPSHKIDVGVKFIRSILSELRNLKLVQIDTIPHEHSCTFDVVFKKLR